MSLCNNKGPFDFGDPCVRASWGPLLIAAFLFVLCTFSVPVPTLISWLFEPIARQFRTYLTLDEAEALIERGLVAEKFLQGDNDQNGTKVHAPLSITRWRMLVFVFVGVTVTLCWLAHGSYLLYDDKMTWWRVLNAFIYAVAWLYTALRPLAWSTATPSFDIVMIYTLLLSASALELGGYLYDHSVYDIPLPGGFSLAAVITNLVAAAGLLVVMAGMPLAIPSERVRQEDIGRTITTEDYTTLSGWITFSWIYPMIHKGRNQTLSEDDVWELSPTLQSRALFIKFSQIKRSTFVRRLWAANSSDILLQFFLAIIGVIFNYGRPFFLKLILQEIDHKNDSRPSKSKAYIYAFLAFLCTLAHCAVDVQHLWFGRRAATRIRSELMASIYEKALKRKDYSGIIDKHKVRKEQEQNVAAGTEHSKKKSKAEKKAEEEKAAMADDPRAGADTGKIVNLMAVDTNKISFMLEIVYNLYKAPFELTLAAVFLYQLLGWSAFSGFFVILLCWPLNKFLTVQNVRIQKGLSVARDKRMGVLNELIGAVKFIKFFAWEDRWINRVLEARQYELKWLVKSRFNSVMYYCLWSCVPSLVSIISLLVYVMQGNILDISTAFTAIALFNMLEFPLNIIPQHIIRILQTGVFMKRIAVFLDEDEVSDQVSSLKTRSVAPHSTDFHTEDGLGFVEASFIWNEAPEDKEEGGYNGKDISRRNTLQTSSQSTIVNETTSSCDIAPINAGFTSPAEDRRFELKDLNIRFPEGELTIITGPTASGKTAMLMALLGEMTTTCGRIVMHKDPFQIDEHGFTHSISYAAQSPWLRHQSIKDNILFGYPFEEERYNAVVEACALKPDLDMLEDGDETEIGVRGVSLSGGQKARVALARAVYARTKYVLLDDPLSAVDSHTSRFLYESLFRGPLLANRTVILVTHHVELVLPGAYYLIRMLDGRIDTHGTIKDLRAKGTLNDITADAEATAQKENLAAPTNQFIEVDPMETRGNPAKKPRKLVKDEHREVGGVKWTIYNTYLKASSYWTWAILCVLIVITELLDVGTKLWMKIWGEAYESTMDDRTVPQVTFWSNLFVEHQVPVHRYSSGGLYRGTSIPGSYSINWPDAVADPYFYIGIYAAIVLGIPLVKVISVAIQWTGALYASRTLFRKMLVTVTRATFRFHDTTPHGRMLNRFGKDIETIDTTLAGSLQAVNTSFAVLFSAVVTIGFVFPLFLIPAFFIGFIYYYLAVGYLETGRDLRRMESNSRSPIFSDFAELLEGIVTVRAFSAENRFLDNLHRKIDVTTKMWYTFWMTNRWLLLNFEALSGLVVLMASLFSVATLNDGAGWAGVTITSAMTFTMSVYWTCRFWTALELDLNSVERVVEYLDLPQEPPAVIEAHRVPAYWPSSENNDCLISVENFTIKYAPELPAVLRNVSFTLKAGERVGLLGRTGSGKSTLAMSVFRFVDPAEGKIIIDGIDILTIGIKDLRSRITFIPQYAKSELTIQSTLKSLDQDATLFSGTLRENLDPFNEFTDTECLDVLQRIQMIERLPGSRTSQVQSAVASPSNSRTPSVLNVPSYTSSDNASSIFTTTSSPIEVDNGKAKVTLDTQVAAGGSNFSQGQRQLIAMARALLRRTSIIVLDEATSSIDFATDAKIQQTIREEFNESLLLTVAHRLNTIIDYDRLIVLDNGQIAEIGTPWELIQKDGIFRNMCLKSGSFTELEEIAKSRGDTSAR